MYTRTERWAAHCFKKFDFEEELADGTLFEGETRWILEKIPERTTKAVPRLSGGCWAEEEAKLNVETSPSISKGKDGVMKTQEGKLKFGWI
ncbi:hypothetical protein AVEN_194083-1 [Araneus ventricosus]|uniref:Uncharacterized protein n=1 Tax=Araneus ventricosus TaxID=182803 RepID=A0A4Y2JAW9_ARAVE|nr:hypothetical protein AVEN_194083-1 [Araneus ventricosus]